MRERDLREGGMTRDDELRARIRKVLSGDQDAYAEIVSSCQDAVRAALGGYCRSTGELEDACHKAFVQAYFKLSDYDPRRGAFLPWLLAVARNAMLEEFRREKAETRRLQRYVERASVRTPVLGDVELATQALERCLTEIDGADAEIIRARYREDRTCEEIAGTLGKTAVATRKLMQRLRERLRACVEKRLAAVQGS